jgi:hypothetical protein
LLNQPAGEIAKAIVEYTVTRVVKAWDEPGMPTQQVTEEVLECLFHPDFHNGRCESPCRLWTFLAGLTTSSAQVQQMMLGKVREWIDSQGHNKQEVLNRLTAAAVKDHRNKRIGDTSNTSGHVHNSMLPEGGLQQVLAQHNVHVVSAVSCLYIV